MQEKLATSTKFALKADDFGGLTMVSQFASHLSERAWENWSSIKWLNSGVLYISRDLDVTAFNALACELLDNQIEIGEPIQLTGFLRPEREEFQILHSMVVGEREYRDFVVTWETNGCVRHVLIDSFRRTDDSNTFLGMHIIMKDLGNFSVLEQHMQRTDKLATVGKIAAGIAHEIRNPLTTLKGFLQILEHRFTEKQMGSELEYANLMLKEIDRVNALVSELLLLSKPHKVEMHECSVATVLNELHPLIASEALLRGVECECVVSELPLVYADPAMLKQVILNIVKNAFEAMESGGTLKIAANENSGFIRLDITDSGPGIPYYQMDKIFDAFFTTKEKGTGLGLPICQRIVADHGGEIRVSSKGFGTTFTVLLPHRAVEKVAYS